MSKGKGSILPIDERNKQMGIVTIDDVEEQFNELLEWEKSDFITKHLDCVVEEGETCDDDSYGYDDVWQFVRDHDDDDILNEIGDDSCFCYLRDNWRLKDFIDELKANGHHIGNGYTDAEIVEELDLNNLKKEVQLNILKQLDDEVIKEYMKK